MRKHPWLVLATTFSFAASAFGYTVTASADSPGARVAPRTFTLVEVATDEAFIDEEPLGEGNPGDRILFRDPLVTLDGRPAGQVLLDCTLHFEDRIQCHGTAEIGAAAIGGNPGQTIGKLELSGTFIDPSVDDRPFWVAITGGTGLFAGRSGQAEVRDSDTPRTTLIFTLR